MITRLKNLDDFLLENKEKSKDVETINMIDELSVNLLNFKKSINEDAKEEYEKYFLAKLKEFGVESPADLDGEEEKKKFFNSIKDGWDKEAGKPKK